MLLKHGHRDGKGGGKLKKEMQPWEQVGGKPATSRSASPKNEEFSYKPAGGGETMRASSDSSSN